MHHCSRAGAGEWKKDWSVNKGLAVFSPKSYRDLTGYSRLPGSSVGVRSQDLTIHPGQGHQSRGSPGETQNNTTGNSEIHVISRRTEAHLCLGSTI